MFLSDTEQLVQEKVSCSFWAFAIMIHSSVCDKLLLSGHSLSHHTMPACVSAGDWVRSYSGNLRREFCPTPWRCPQREPRTLGQSVVHAFKCTLGHTSAWAFMGKALQDKSAPNLHTELHCSALAASTHRENTRDILQLTGMHRVIKNYLWDPICTTYKAELVGMMLQKWPTEVCRPPGRLLWK